MELPTKLINNDKKLWVGAEMGNARIGKVHRGEYYMEERGDNVGREDMSY